MIKPESLVVKTLPQEAALAIALRALDGLKRRGLQASISLVSRYGLRILVYLGMDGVREFTMNVALNKARQAANTGKATEVFAAKVKEEGDNPELYNIAKEDLIEWAGGLPIYDHDGTLLGGIGISNLKSHKEREVAKEAVEGEGLLTEKPVHKEE